MTRTWQDRKALEDMGIERGVNLSARDHALPDIVYERFKDSNSLPVFP
jgi:hypothetical protein